MAKYIYRGKTIEVPEWAKYIADFDGEIAVSCCDRKPISWGLDELSVTPDWKESAQSIDELYIPWGGGDMPVPYGTHIDVVYRNGIENLHVIAGGSDVDGSGGSHNDKYANSWDRVNLESDIIAYRISKDKNPNAALYWRRTPQGLQFWSDVDNGKYDVVGDIDDGDAVDESYTDIVDCAEDDFIVGDTVKLNSGGPLMTVDMVTDDCIYVVWFNDSEYIYCHHMFIKSTIHLVD